eukprot:TRINITY_DN106910_c0_g1_i1.p1 TRINITY_DN106910_c0_g1~~TRINITY_DN106910_c0_g1_i1.p1  ORF type:complete len:485 (+),score=88.32 TRINITY_DN106910_c0_g1_i1:175-1629(+)
MAAAEGEPRVLSLLSATTEIVCRLGLAHRLVGRSHGCDDPPLAMARPVVTAPKVDPNAASADIDVAVREQAARGGPVYHIYNASIKELKPDVIITQNQCRICAVTKDDVQAACALLGDHVVEIVTVEPKKLADVLSDVMVVATACRVPDRGRRLVNHLKASMERVRSTVAEASKATAPKVAHLEWIDPLMGSGYWIAECIEAAGGHMICGHTGGNSGTLDGLEKLKEADVIIIAPCGFSIERTKAEVDACKLFADPEFLQLPALLAGRCFIADGNKYFNRSSCGVVETAEMVAEMCHEELLGLWGHHGRLFVTADQLNEFCSRPEAPAPTKAVAGPDPAHGFQAPPERFTDAGYSHHGDCLTPTAATHGSAMGPTDVVRAQLQALQEENFDTAFAYNSEKNQARLGGASKFAEIVRGTSFRVLTDSRTSIKVSTPEFCKGAGGNSAAVRVDAVSPDGCCSRFIFDLAKAAPDLSWATEGVRIEC